MHGVSFAQIKAIICHNCTNRWPFSCCKLKQLSEYRDSIMKKVLWGVICIIGCFLVTACQQEQDTQEVKPVTKVINDLDEQTLEEPQYLGAFKVLSSYQGDYQGKSAIIVNVNHPIKQSLKIREHAKVFLEDDNEAEGSWVMSENSKRLYFPFIKANTQYKVYLSSDLESANGVLLGESYSNIIKTGFFNPSVSFVSQGSTLLSDSGFLPIEAINVDSVDVKFWRIKPKQYHDFFTSIMYQSYNRFNRLKEFGELVHSSRYELENEPNVRNKHNLNVGDINQLKSKGVYAVTLQSSKDYDDVSMSWFVISDIGIHTRSYENKIVVFTHQLPSAEVYSNVKVSLLDEQSNLIMDKTTDVNGFAEFSGINLSKLKYITASKGDNINILKMQSPKLDLSEFKLTNRLQKPQELFLYSARDLYRPAEQVIINGLLRDQDGRLISALPIKAKIIQPNNKVFKTLNWQGDEQSFYRSSFTLPKNAVRGNWRFVAEISKHNSYEYVFKVEDFLPERLSLSLDSKVEHLSSEETPIVLIHSDYLYGAPASNNRYDGTIQLKSLNGLKEQFEGFVFGSNYYRDFNQLIDLSPGKLNELGKAEVAVKNIWQKTAFPLSLTTSINVYEGGGRPISRKIQQTVWPHPMLIGVRPLWSTESGRHFAQPDSINQVELIALDKSLQPISVEPLEIRLIREDARYYWQHGANGWDYQSSSDNQIVFSETRPINSKQSLKLNLPLEYGNYRLDIAQQNGTLLTSYKFFAGWSWVDVSSIGERPDQVHLSLNADSIMLGEKFDLTIKPPFAGTALVTIESDALLYKKVYSLKEGEQSITLQLDKEWQQHNLYASVMVIKHGDVARKHLPTRAFGLIHLPLDRSEREFMLSMEHPEKLIPEESFEVKLVSNLKNKKQHATLALVDTGILNISDFKTPDAAKWFFAKRAYQASVRDNYGSLIELIDANKVKQKFGGDADLSRGGDAPLSDVQIVSIVKDNISFDDNGEAIVTVSLPYFNGQLRLMALAFSDDEFASQESKITIAAPLVAQASLPRFLAKGDQSLAVIDLRNMEQDTQTLELQVEADELLGGKNLVQSITLDANQRYSLELPLLAKSHTGLSSITFKASVQSKTSNYQLTRNWSVGFRPVFPAHISKHSKVLAEGQSFTFDKSLGDVFDESHLSSIMSLSSSPPINFEEYLGSLIQYPYGCLEQTTSRAWPLLMVNSDEIQLDNKSNKYIHDILSNKQEFINNAISRILSMQRYDGSFGTWSHDNPESHWLTVYATDFLLEAKKSGYVFSEDALQKAIKRLGVYTRGQGHNNHNQYYHDKAHYHLAYSAYAAYVLAKINKVNLQDVRRLFDKFSDNSRSSLPVAHLALALEMMGDEQRAKKAWQKAFTHKNPADGYYYYGDYGTPVRNTSLTMALSLESLLVKQERYDNLSLMHSLKHQIDERRWLSTQENSSLFLLSRKLQQHKDAKQWTAEISLAGKVNELDKHKDFFMPFKGDAVKQDITITNKSKAPLYIDYKIQGYPKMALTDGNPAISIIKDYYDIQGNPIDFSTVSSGDSVLVHLSISVDGNRYSHIPDAMVVDLIPSGFDIENQNLKHSFDISALTIAGQSIDQLMQHNNIQYLEYRDDRFVAAMPVSSYQTHHLLYMMRAVTPGTYKVPVSLIEDMYRPEIRQYSQQQADVVVKARGD